MKTVLFLTDVLAGTHIAKLEGVYERARRYGWHVIGVEYENSSRPIADYFKTWHPDGCIVVGASLTAPLEPKAFASVATVYLDPDEKTRRRCRHCVISDPEPLAQMAADELSQLGCASYAYVGWSETTAWSEDRRQAFERVIKAKGRSAAAFTEPSPAKDKVRTHRRLAEWLKRLPKPCGVFCANDMTASRVADACLAAGLGIPADVAIVGVDNQEIVCENAASSITSIEIDFRESGRESADLLKLLLDDPDHAPETRFFGPGRIVRRQSTRRLPKSSPAVERALERIRREAILGLTATDVIEETGLPRRAAERRFRQATGSSILAEINRHRLEHAFTLLARSDYPISLIAQQCGWKDDVFLKRLFKRTTGMTMREWRNARLREDPSAARPGASRA